MNPNIQKKEIIDWISALDNQDILQEVYQLKTQLEPFDFDTEFANGLTTDQFRQKTTEFLKSLPWKKQG